MSAIPMMRRSKLKSALCVIVCFSVLSAIWYFAFGITKNCSENAPVNDGVNVEEKSQKSDSRKSALNIGVISSRSQFLLQVDGKEIINDEEPKRSRGMHVAILDKTTGQCTAYRVFDTYLPGISDTMLLPFLLSIPEGRIVVVGVKDEGSFHFGNAARKLFAAWGSSYAGNLQWRDMWIFIAVKVLHGFIRLGESFTKAPSFSTWALPVTLDYVMELDPIIVRWNCSGRSVKRLREFCEHTDGYPEICHCDNPEPVTFFPSPLPERAFVEKGRSMIPVGIIAGNRPFYLNTMLRTLLSTAGVDPRLITIFIDGLWDEPARVARLYGLSAVQHIPGGHGNARISQHYKSSLTTMFARHPLAEYAIVLEEDLEVSPDFFHFVVQTVPLLREDASLYCISAWNDLGYEHSVGDPQLLYRVETMPGLGWVIPRKLFVDELQLNWPSPNFNWDWDMWMRSPAIRKGRECIVPDISRTYHFGASGLNMNPIFQTIYFERHAVYKGPLKDLHLTDLTENGYERKLRDLLSVAVPVNHSVSPCRPDFFPAVSDKTLSVFIRMDNSSDFKTWLEFCRCLKIWDLDQRGSHKGLWRFFSRPGQAVVVIGVPSSPYSKFLPKGVQVIDLVSAVERLSSYTQVPN
ncbi:protein O-linked-mannose beta-1,2-N-acetylglucosaminyltransferase 1-like [Paramacrobiotus metropolitanus]|uniref:protein O-linked-mannose beta-1,2-N-acetylglucosaminyltransferase 1-like n=1 Tax=Paramacrobiotus metropolitanus TaxID=2943436 RepID=UPI002445F825|nr:protein O-linked-mannose beta-1,2-N-acetylglucosaminyltransferase 1-like [Paramacrobiotus metropolitanus]